MTCIFCYQIKEQDILYRTEHFKVVWDVDPIQTGHLLIISKEHYQQLSQVPPPVRYELSDLEEKLCQALAIDGVTIACNDRLFVADTHFHVHLIPRFHEDGFWEQIRLTQAQFNLLNVFNTP